jgi:hypothetical protein
MEEIMVWGKGLNLARFPEKISFVDRKTNLSGKKHGFFKKGF